MRKTKVVVFKFNELSEKSKTKAMKEFNHEELEFFIESEIDEFQGMSNSHRWEYFSDGKHFMKSYTQETK